MLRARSVCAVAGDVKYRCVVDVKRHAAEPFLEAYPQHNLAAEDCFLHGGRHRHQFRLHCRLRSESLNAHLEVDRAVRKHYDV